MTTSIVLVHGIRLSATMRRPHVRRLTPDFRVSAADLPGHGTLAARPFTLDAAGAAAHDAALETREATGRRPPLLDMSTPPPATPACSAPPAATYSPSNTRTASPP
ncbi:alpha/beta fold hydrolase [Kitasatospora sp. NPDC004615]|uniref:alpha/beta fold hydrolase n=1 Tax=Kitasatospora sp. NPDC004615 TaxID=3364017 RepID=UPI0036A74478